MMEIDSFKNNVVFILCKSLSGTGFFLAPNLICTSWHVIANNDFKDIAVLWNNKELQVSAITCYENDDIAFLETKDIENYEWLSIYPVFELKNGVKCSVFGYPEGYEDIGSPLLLTFTGTDQFNRILSFSDDNVTYGYSGAPIVNEQGFLIGMLVISRDINSPTGGRGISAMFILELLCNDKNLYIYALKMLQESSRVMTKKYQWIYKNKNIETAVETYLRCCLGRNSDITSFAVLRPYLGLFFGEQAYSSKENIYILVARLLIEKYDNLCELFVKWLVNNKNYEEKTYVQQAIHFMETKILPLPNKSLEKVDRICKQLQATRIAGSSCMKVSDLFLKRGKLKVSFQWESDDIKSKSKKLEKIIIDRIKKGENIFVLANPGIGKSTLAKSLFFEFIRLRQRVDINLLPLYFDLNRELSKGEKSFDAEWLKKQLFLQYDDIDNIFLGTLNSNVVLILDGLDEYLDGLRREEIKFFLSTELFNNSNRFKIIITCREQFYIRSLIGFNTSIDAFSKIKIIPWEKEKKEEYIKQYILLLKRKHKVAEDCENEIVLNKIANSPFLNEVTNTPLYLNMTLEVLGNDNGRSIKNIVELYEQYSYNWIRNEIWRIHGKYILDETIWDDPTPIMNILARVSWRYHDFAFAGRFENSDRVYFSYREIEVCLYEIKNEMRFLINDTESIRALAKFIVNHTFFITDSSEHLYFIHKSFYEYFTAKFIFDLLINSDADFSAITMAHSSLLSPEVSELIKEHIKNIENLRNMQHCILNNCIKSLDCLRNGDDIIKLDIAGRRMSKQQIIYHMGLIKLNESSIQLMNILRDETDLLIKRGIIIGLAFSGDEYELQRYIDRMRKEQKQRRPWKENEVNIGFSLSFFGDQPYDNYAPEIDQNLPHCKNTVERLVYQLSTDIDRPSWRCNLYTLVYLFDKRPISKKEYCATIVNIKSEIYRLLDKMENFYKLRWPEISELKEILDNIQP